MSQQFSSRYPADVVEHGKFGTHLALLMPPLAALLYPFLLEAFHANISPVIRGQSAEPALRSAVAASFLLLAFIAPIVALLGAMRLGELAAPSVANGVPAPLPCLRSPPRRCSYFSASSSTCCTTRCPTSGCGSYSGLS